MPTMEFIYHQDPAHGWVEVSINTLKELGANLSDISGYSYYSPMTTGTLVYLEEDGDVLVLINALKEKGIGFQFKSRLTHHDHWIRGLSRFTEWLDRQSYNPQYKLPNS